MGVTLDQFVEHLTDSGLMSADEVSAFQDSLPDVPADGETLAKLLVRQKKLTKYQATAVYQGKIKHLKFGEYVVVDKIGKGGMGVVLKAHHRRMDRDVAVKVLPAKMMQDEDAEARFYREVQAAAKLTHPNVVHAYDAGEHDGLHYLIMEYVEGRDLAEIVHEHGPLPVEQAVECVRQAAQGLQYAHEEGIVHRDIKPGNLLLDKKGTVKILDMGLARLNVGGLGEGEEKQPEQLTQSGQIMGTVDYMAPEQAEDTRKADHRADIYALGCTLFRLVTGSPVYERDTVMRKLLAHREDEIPSMVQLRSDVPPRLTGVFQRMVAKNVDERFQSMTEVIAALETAFIPAPQAARPAAPKKEESSNMALSAFFQHIGDGQVVTKPQTTAATPEETINRKLAAEDTGDSIAEVEPLQPGIAETPQANSPAVGVNRKKTHRQRPTKSTQQRLILIGSVGAAAVLLLIVVGFALFGPDGSDNLNLAGGDNGAGDGPGQPDKPNYELEFDGKSSWVQLPGIVDDLRKPITVEAFITPKRATQSASTVFLGLAHGKFCIYAADGHWRQQLATTGNNELLNTGWPVEVAKTIHIAGVSDKSGVRLYIDGENQDGRRTGDQGISPGEGVFYLGASQLKGSKPGRAFHGTIDEVRISNTARYTENFTPPQPHERFTKDEHTLALYHCDEIPGGKLIDSSGNGHHGTVHNCKLVRVGKKQTDDPDRAAAEWVLGIGGTVTTDAVKFTDVGLLPEHPFQIVSVDLSGNGQVTDGNLENLKGLTILTNLQIPGTKVGDSCLEHLKGLTNLARLNLKANKVTAQGIATLKLALPNCKITSDFSDEQIEVAMKELSGGTNPPLPNGWVIGSAVNLGPPVNSVSGDGTPFVSSDGLILMFYSDRDGGQGSSDIWMCTRASIKEPFSNLVNLGESVNSSAADMSPRLLEDNETLIFHSNRIDASQGQADLWTSSRPGGTGEFGNPMNLGPIINSGERDNHPGISHDGLTLLFSSNRAGGQGNDDIWMATRTSITESFDTLTNLGPTVNSAALDMAPCLSSDGLSLVFHSERPGGYGDYDLWLSTRNSINDPFDTPVNLGPTINTSAGEASPYLSADGRKLYFDSNRSGGQGGFDIYAAPIKLQPPLAKAPFGETEAKKHQKAWADYLGVEVEREIELPGGEKLTMVLIPPGEFMMGSDDEKRAQLLQMAKTSRVRDIDAARIDREAPQHAVRISQPFYLGKYEVTQAQWQAVMGTNPAKHKDNPSHPVEMVSWNDTQLFLAKLNQTGKQALEFQLPTEAHWEYACRAGTTSFWHFGDEPAALAQYGWFKVNSGGETNPIGQLRPNPFGVHDMYGNVNELCSDWYGERYYADLIVNDPKGPADGPGRIIRGGNFGLAALACRSANRSNQNPGQPANFIGFRLAAAIEDTSANNTETDDAPKKRQGGGFKGGGGGRGGGIGGGRPVKAGTSSEEN
jgi:serine/threonine protein kinase/formylglycine-generating enzyme required for sulfatase activity